jgi:hypothetical protein
MKHLIAILAMLPALAGAQVYISTNSAGGMIATRYREDHQWAVGAVTTSAVMPQVASELPLPAQFAEGVAVQRDGHWVEAVPHDGVMLAVQISDSPIDPATRDARIAAAVASATSDKSTWRADMQAFRGSVQTNIADAQAIATLPAGFTAAQNRAAVNALRSELIDAFREINQLRKLLRQYAREQAEE